MRAHGRSFGLVLAFVLVLAAASRVPGRAGTHSTSAKAGGASCQFTCADGTSEECDPPNASTCFAECFGDCNGHGGVFTCDWQKPLLESSQTPSHPKPGVSTRVPPRKH